MEKVLTVFLKIKENKIIPFPVPVIFSMAEKWMRI